MSTATTTIRSHHGTWTKRTTEAIHGPAQLREHVYSDRDGREYLGDVVYVRRPVERGTEYGWVREGLAYTNPKVLPRLAFRSKADAIADLLRRNAR